MKHPLLIQRAATTAASVIALASLSSCVSPYETVNQMVVPQGPTNAYYSQDVTVLRDTGGRTCSGTTISDQLWRINRDYPCGPVWEPIGTPCAPTSYSSK